MYIDKIYSELIAKMVERLSETKLEEFEAYTEWADKHHTIISELVKLKQLEPVVEIPVEEVEEKIKEEIVVSTNPDPYPLNHNFMFEKKAYGGVIVGLNYPIPEDLVRHYGIESGNILKITGVNGHFPDGSPRYKFEVIDTTCKPNPQLMEVKLGKVERVGGRLVVNETASGKSIMVEDSPATLFLQEKDIHNPKFKITDGDIIDGRFYVNNINSFRVTYKHDTEEMGNAETVESRRLSYRQNNPTESEAGLSMIDRLDMNPFLNKKIVLIGLSSRVNDFKMYLDKVEGMQFVHLTGDEHKMKIRSNLASADFAVISTFENSHDTSTYCAEICNTYGIPCTSTHAVALTGVLNDLRDLINKQEIQVKC